MLSENNCLNFNYFHPLLDTTNEHFISFGVRLPQIAQFNHGKIPGKPKRLLSTTTTAVYVYAHRGKFLFWDTGEDVIFVKKN